jgi:hypothetical protein
MRKFNLALGILTATSTLSALWSWQQLHIERTRAADLEFKLAALQSPGEQAPDPAARPPAREKPVDKPPSDSTPALAQPAPQETLSAQELEVRRHIRSMQQREREMLRDPNYRKAQLEAGRRQFARTRADAIRVVGMTPEQADRVVDLWVERNLRFTELGGSSLERPSEAMQTEMKRAGEAEQAELRSLLGEEKYERWSRYLASSQERGEVSQFRFELSASADPLGDSQADALVEAIYSERQRRTREYEEYVRSAGITDRNVVSPQDRQRWLDLEKEANQRVHEAVAGTLSRAQLARLDEMLAARLLPIETALRMQLEGKLAKSN